MSIFMQIQNLMAITEVETFVKLVLIVILSGIVGYERESWINQQGLEHTF